MENFFPGKPASDWSMKTLNVVGCLGNRQTLFFWYYRVPSKKNCSVNNDITGIADKLGDCSNIKNGQLNLKWKRRMLRIIQDVRRATVVTEEANSDRFQRILMIDWWLTNQIVNAMCIYWERGSSENILCNETCMTNGCHVFWNFIKNTPGWHHHRKILSFL